MGVIAGQLGGSIRIIGVTSPVIEKLELTLASTDYTFVFPATTKEILLRNVGNAIIEYRYDLLGESLPLFIQEVRLKDNLNLSSTLTIYFKSPKANQILKLEYWL